MIIVLVTGSILVLVLVLGVSGDTVLKMSMTWAVFLSYPSVQEGELTIAR